MTRKKLPKTLYVAVHGQGEDAWIEPSSAIEGAIEDDGPTNVGVYRLERTVIAKKKIAISVSRAKARKKLNADG